jgi:probable addiction module antidote protein
VIVIRSVRVCKNYASILELVIECIWSPRPDRSNFAVCGFKEIAIFGHQNRKGLLGRLETEAGMSKKLKAVVSHHDREVAELRADRELAVEYLKAAMESLDSPDDRAAGLLALRTVAEAYGGLGAVAAEAGISRESLYRTLSAKGNPTLKTLLAVLKAVGMKLSVEPEHHATA